jgi:large subunit ribosomal protein L23
VKDVHTANFRGKLRRVGRSEGKKAAYKKAVVTLVEGERIDVYEGI